MHFDYIKIDIYIYLYYIFRILYIGNFKLRFIGELLAEY